MKNLVLFLFFTPIFLITSLNFHNENEDGHVSENNRFTCSSCHATIIDGIIVGGKEVDSDYISFEFAISNNLNFETVVLDLERKSFQKTNFSVYTTEVLNNFLIMEFDETTRGKKDNRIKIRHKISDEERQAGFIEIQGVFSDLDGTKENDFAFSKQISISEEEIKLIEPVKLFPSVASSFVQLENLAPSNNILIFNTIGQQVYKQQNTSETEKIDISSFENGNYFVLVNQKQQLRFIVSK